MGGGSPGPPSFDTEVRSKKESLSSCWVGVRSECLTAIAPGYPVGNGREPHYCRVGGSGSPGPHVVSSDTIHEPVKTGGWAQMEASTPCWTFSDSPLGERVKLSGGRPSTHPPHFTTFVPTHTLSRVAHMGILGAVCVLSCSPLWEWEGHTAQGQRLKQDSRGCVSGPDSLAFSCHGLFT